MGKYIKPWLTQGQKLTSSLKRPKIDLICLHNLTRHTGHRKDFVGVCEDFDVSVKGVTIKQNIFVINSTNHAFILGMLFMIKAHTWINWNSSMYLIMTYYLPDDHSTAVCKVLNWDQFLGPTKAKLFLSKSLNKTAVNIPGWWLHLILKAWNTLQILKNIKTGDIAAI